MEVHSIRSPRLFVLLVLVLALFCLLIVKVPKASAYIPECGTGEWRRDYYSDSTRTTLIGGKRYTCDCVMESWGSTSSYSYERILPCL
jgi:hypothetical protein